MYEFVSCQLFAFENLHDTHFFILVETFPDGRPRGFAHVSFENVKNAVAAVLSASEEPIHLGGRDLNVNFARPKANSRANNEPNEKLYFSGCTEGEAALRELMKDLEGDIVSVHFCALFFFFTPVMRRTPYLFTLRSAR